MPAHAHIVRQIPEDPLLTFLTLSPSPPDFVPGKWLTQDRMHKLGIFHNEFPQPEEEKKLVAHVLMNHESAPV